MSAHKNAVSNELHIVGLKKLKRIRLPGFDLQKMRMLEQL
jgi:hypothetical protein